MATTQTLRTGSRGNDVKALQEALIKMGYDVGSTGADGVYGTKTTAAVKQYQKDNGLAVDGIAGKNTLGSLSGSSSGSSSASRYNAQKPSTQTSLTGAATVAPAGASGVKPALPEHKTGKVNLDGGTAPTIGGAIKPPATPPATPPTTPPAENTKTEPAKTDTETPKATQNTGAAPASFTYDPFTYDKEFTYDPFTYEDFTYDDFTYGSYTPSQAVQDANNILQQHQANKPGEYKSQWQGQIDGAFNAYTNRDPFSYNFNSDALYQQYKDSYIQQGRMAMMDTMGQAAAMTGGYGNSYAQTVGQQAYNQQLNQLNDVIPELYQMAYGRYQDEGTRLYNQYNMLMARENKDYARWQDTMNNWYRDRDYYTDRYDTESSNDYNRWLTDRNQAWDEYKTNRDHAYDQYTTDRGLAYDQYVADRGIAYDEYTYDRDLAYDEYTYGRDKAWDEYVTQQEKDAAAAELMAGAGDYDRLAQIYGLSDSELATIKEANAPKPTGGGTGPTGPTYKNLTPSEIAGFRQEFGRMSPEEAVMWAQMYAQQGGYDPNVLTGIANAATGGYQNPEAIDTTVDNTAGDQGNKNFQAEKNKRNAGGIATGYMYKQIY